MLPRVTEHTVNCYAPEILNKAEFNIIIALMSSISTSLCVILTLFEFAIKFYFSQCHTN